MMASRFGSTLHDEFRGRLLEAREALLRTVAAIDEEMAGLVPPEPRVWVHCQANREVVP